MIQKIDKKAVQEALRTAYESCKNETGGKNADYKGIPRGQSD